MTHPGHTIRTQREALDLTRRELARRAGVSFAYLSKVERGIGNPTRRWLDDVADAIAAELIERGREVKAS